MHGETRNNISGERTNSLVYGYGHSVQTVRINVDLKPLNKSVMREVHPLQKVDITLAQLTGAKVFSKLDTNSGFWQVPLAKQSTLLTTFIAPHGRIVLISYRSELHEP